MRKGIEGDDENLDDFVVTLLRSIFVARLKSIVRNVGVMIFHASLW